ncbi:MAG: murein hydrolase activator EnvC family protein [Breznakibacter sp.]
MRFVTVPLFLFLVFLTQGQGLQDLNRQKDELLKNIASTNRLILEYQGKQTNELLQISLLDGKISDRQSLIALYTKEVAISERNLAKLTHQLDSLKKEIQLIKQEYGNILYHLSVNKLYKNDISYIIGAGSFNESYRRFLFLQQYNEYRKKQGTLLSKKSLQYAELKEKIEVRRKMVVNSLKMVQNEEAQLAQELTDRQQKVKLLKSQEAQLRKEAKEADKKAKELENKILAFIRESAKSSKGKIVSSVIKDNKGRLPWPIDKGLLISEFGEHEHPVIKNLKIKNNGIDIQMGSSNDVRSVFEGLVSRVIAIPGYNATVIIRHGSVLTVYSNLVNVSVRQDQKVVIGEKIGEIYQGEGKNSGVLHFELWEEEAKQNPTHWLK